MLPPKSNSRRPLALAVLMTRALGTYSVTQAAILLILVAMSSPVMPDIFLAVLLIAVGTLLVLPGIAFIGFSFPMENRRTWAAITVLVIDGLQLPLMLVGVIRTVLARRADLMYLLVNAVLPGLLCILGVLTLVFVARALPTMRSAGMRRALGFEPIMRQSPPAPAAPEQPRD